MISYFLTHPLLKIINNRLIKLPTPINIRNFWNFGRLLRVSLLTQILRGLFLAMHYIGDIESAFNRISHICRDVNYGWLLRITHANGASFFFIRLYLHIGRGIYYGSYIYIITWGVGLLIFLLTIAAAFLGYVLPWGQISFWGATVITNLASAIPFLGLDIVRWLWGGFAVDKATLTRFFSLHFIIPFLLIGLIIIHLIFLHQTGSNNPLGLLRNTDKIPFHPYHTYKDIVGVWSILLLLFLLNLLSPWILGDSENFIPANPLLTPVHIQPEWYYLFAYAILRSIPNKLGGVIALVSRVIILLILPHLFSSKFRNYIFYPINQYFFWSLIRVFILLTWIGARPVEEPYVFAGQIFTILYFIFFFLRNKLSKFWDYLLN